MVNQKMKICSILLVIKEIQTKMKCHFLLYRLTTIQRFFIKYRVDSQVGEKDSPLMYC